MNQKQIKEAVLFEGIASSLQDVIVLKQGGADRVELVHELGRGGLTPAVELVEQALDCGIDLAVMVRPHDRGFVYDASERSQIRKELLTLKRTGVKHVVFGALDTQLGVDERLLEELFGDLDVHVTFHRAIDEAKDILHAVEVLEQYPFVTHILTSGGVGAAEDHLELIRRMIRLSSKRIIVGSGVNLGNIHRIEQALKGHPHDIHLGTALRGGVSDRPVQAALVQHVRQILDRT